MVKEVIHIACPCCNNKRLFDLLVGEAKGIISIKCPSCRAVVSVSLHGYKYGLGNVTYEEKALCAESSKNYKI